MHPTSGRSRKQVSRACDWCRARRIGCDNGQPCTACLKRGSQCTRRGLATDEPRTLPQALREIDALKSRVRELEAELLTFKSGMQPVSIPTPGSSSACSPDIDRRQTLQQSVAQTPAATEPFSQTLIRRRNSQWQGIFVATARTEQPSYYGPASSFYFISRMGGFLGKALKHQFADKSMYPRGANRSVHLGPAVDDDGTGHDVVQASGPESGQLTREQEEPVLKLFWEGYHCLYPVLDETDFRRHYASLWEPRRRSRKPSALADIIIALCLQYGYVYLPRQTLRPDQSSIVDDPTLAGRFYYRRAQALLTADLESPSIATIQCYIFFMAYLCCASFQNMCHIVSAQAVRAAQIVGLHLEPPTDMPRGERELRKRIWWSVWIMEVKTSAKHGRPFLVDPSYVTVTPPEDDHEVASYNGAALGSFGLDVTWLTYTLQAGNLFRVMVGIHDALFFKYGDVMGVGGSACIYKSPEALESCARLLSAQLPDMKMWVAQLPAGIKMQRVGGKSSPYSTDRSCVEIDALVPTWLQRQRVILELIYHSMIVNLTRPFITFYSHSQTYSPLTECHATTCVQHAITFTLITHQVLTETDLLSAWTEQFTIQWNIAITLVGFILANPIHPATQRARQALDKALEIFDTFGESFAVSADAAKIMRELIAKADLLAGRLGSGITSSAEVDSAPTVTSHVVMRTPESQDGLEWLDPNLQVDSTDFGGFMDWALSVDSYNDFERFFDMNKPVEAWPLGQNQFS